MSDDVAAAVRAYLAVVADLGSTEEQLRAVLHPDVHITEWPNAVTPRGARRGVDESVAGFAAGKALLSAQEFDVHEVLVDGDRAAVRATWRATIGADRGPFTRGQVLVSHIAAFLTVREGRVAAHETYDCYEPFS